MHENYAKNAFQDKCINEKSTCVLAASASFSPFKAVDPAGLEPATPDYESGATNRLSGASHDENQRVMKTCLDCIMTLLTGLPTYLCKQILG